MAFLKWTLVKSHCMITLDILKLSEVVGMAKHGDFFLKIRFLKKNRFVIVTAIGVIYGIIKHNWLYSKTCWSLISKPWDMPVSIWWHSSMHCRFSLQNHHLKMPVWYFCHFFHRLFPSDFGIFLMKTLF